MVPNYAASTYTDRPDLCEYKYPAHSTSSFLPYFPLFLLQISKARTKHPMLRALPTFQKYYQKFRCEARLDLVIIFKSARKISMGSEVFPRNSNTTLGMLMRDVYSRAETYIAVSTHHCTSSGDKTEFQCRSFSRNGASVMESASLVLSKICNDNYM